MRDELAFSRLQPILSVLFLVFAFCFFTSHATLYMLTHNWLALICILLFLVYVIKNIRIGILTIRNIPAIILTEESIVITAKGDTVEWTDIADIYMTSNSFGNINLVKFFFVTIRLRDPEKYLKSIKNPFIRNYRWFTRNWRSSPVEVSLFLVKGDDEEIYQLILKYYQHFRGF